MNVFENDRWNEPQITGEFYTALAAALGATDLELEHKTARMTAGELRLVFRQGYGANVGKARVSAYVADRDTGIAAAKAFGRAPEFPSANIDPTRDMAALVRDIQKRVIEKSAPMLAAMHDRAAEQRTLNASVNAQAEALTKAFPGLRVTVNDHDAYVHGPGISGTMDSNGGLYLQSLSLDADKARRVLAILTAA